MVSETVIGEGGTTSWYLGGIDRNSTIAFILDLAPNAKETVTNKNGTFQFITIYRHSSGR